MKKIIIIFTAIIAISLVQSAYCATSFFDLMNLADTFINSENEIKIEKSEAQKQIFKSAVDKYSQGNISASYDDFIKLTDTINNDYALMNLAKSLYKAGFFSLSENALSKIKYKDNLKNQITDLKKSYSPKKLADKNEEIYLAKAISSIYFDNCAQETVFELNKNKELLNDSDYANYVMALGQTQLKQYNQALNFINKAIAKNPENAEYIYRKVKILTYKNDYKNALKTILHAKKKKLITNNFKRDFKLQEQYIKEKTAKNETERKYIEAKIAYDNDDVYKSLKICDDILSLDKKNAKTLNLYAKNHYKLKNLNKAKEYSAKALPLAPSNPEIIETQGDIEFADFNYKMALANYKKAQGKDRKNLRLINKIILTSIFAAAPETQVAKYVEMSRKINGEPFFEFYEIATTIAKYTPNNEVDLSEEYLKKAIVFYPLHNDSWLEFAKIQIEKGNIAFAKNILNAVYLSKNVDFKYYFISALADEAAKNESGTIKNLKQTIELNSDFVPAIEMLNVYEQKL